MAIALEINGVDRTVDSEVPLLWVLRDVPGVAGRHGSGREFDALRGRRRHIEPVFIAEVEVDPIVPCHRLKLGNKRRLSPRPRLIVKFEGTVRAR